jgi:hypothetical protein
VEKPVASRLIEAIVALDVPIGRLDGLSDQITDPEEKAAFRRALGDLMGHIYGQLMIPILRPYPDLDPDKDK